MDFSLVPLDTNRFLNFTYLGLSSNGKSLVALFNTRGNTMVRESQASDLDLRYIDQDFIDGKYKRAILSDLLVGGLKLNEVPVLVGKDELFDLGRDNLGRTNDCDMVLGWNVISQFSWRGDYKDGKFEVQTSDFRKPSESKTNQPIINIGYEEEIIKAAIDSSRPTTLISKDLAKKIASTDEDVKNTLDMLGESANELTYINKVIFDLDGKKVKIGPCQIEDSLKDIDLVFGADILTNTKWAIYGPMNYVRLTNY